MRFLMKANEVVSNARLHVWFASLRSQCRVRITFETASAGAFSVRRSATCGYENIALQAKPATNLFCKKIAPQKKVLAVFYIPLAH
jgi:hypothetical protein